MNLSDEERLNILCPDRILSMSFKYPENKHDRRYTLTDHQKTFFHGLVIQCLTTELTVAFRDQSEAKQKAEFIQVPFRDWKNAMGDKRVLKVGAILFIRRWKLVKISYRFQIWKNLLSHKVLVKHTNSGSFNIDNRKHYYSR